ncbi:MAG: SagB family peptide dehydrogenase [Epsilonproteobacteria bacterium]|nr:SagB family peptide dehydrogenase [Campylobacterota bacterium]
MYNYHEETKHSYQSIRNKPNYLDWNLQPSTFKIYNQFENMIILEGENRVHNFIYRLGGVTVKKQYPNSKHYLRTIPSAGALYPVEIYFQARDVEGFEDGVYHFDIANSAVKLLYRLKGDGVESVYADNRAVKGFIFFYSTLYFRSFWKYKNRAFRYCLLDCGHALGGIEASCYLYEHAYVIHYQFDKKRLNDAFGFGKQEFFLASVVVGISTEDRVSAFDMQLDDINPVYERSSMIEEVYEKSIALPECESKYTFSPFTFHQEVFEESIFKRRSIRNFTTSMISKASYESILEIVQKPIMSDCDTVVQLYAIVNEVEGVQRGLYLDGKCIKVGDFREKAGYLCLEQALGRQSAVTFFLTTSSQNYQSAYQKAGILGHRIYLASEYFKIGCSGIGAYYDDETKAFLETKDMILYGVTIGT